MHNLNGTIFSFITISVKLFMQQCSSIDEKNRLRCKILLVIFLFIHERIQNSDRGLTDKK